MSKLTPVITIDGPGGSGKGTLARLLAHELGWNILDSGAIYRLLAVASQQKKLVDTDEPALAQLASDMHIGFSMAEGLHIQALLENKDVSEQIRGEEIGNLASKISSFAAVRQALLQKQRDFLQAPGLVTDGRDMGTVVFPDATIKLFLVACPKERAERRYNQLKNKEINVTLAQILNEIEQRDRRDTERAVAPLKPAEDSIVVDSSGLTIQQVFSNVLSIVQQRLK